MHLFLTIQMHYCYKKTTLLTIATSLRVVTTLFFATAVLLTLKTKTWISTLYFTICANKTGQPVKNIMITL